MHWNWMLLFFFCLLQPIRCVSWSQLGWKSATITLKWEWQQSLLSSLIDSWSMWQRINSFPANFHPSHKMQMFSGGIPRHGCGLHQVSVCCSHILWHFFDIFVTWLLPSCDDCSRVSVSVLVQLRCCCGQLSNYHVSTLDFFFAQRFTRRSR